MKALLDTDIVSELMRAKNAVVLGRSQAYLQQHDRLPFSTITVFEIMQGLHHMNRVAQASDFAAWCKSCDVVEFDVETAELAGEIGGALMRTGRIIGVSDTCIAAAALRHNRVLVTGNIRHYEHVRAAGFALELDNWREPAPAPIG